MREDGRSSVHRLVQEGGDRVAASDLGLNRLRTAVGVVVAVGTTLGVEWVLARLAGVGSRDAFSAVLFGAVVAVTGSVGLSSGPSRQKVLTVVASVVALGAGVVLGAAVFRDTGLLLGVFVVVLFAAVYVRRFGQPFFVAGMMAWTGYFFTSLLGASFDRLPWLILSGTVAVVWVLLLSLTVLKENPECTLRRTLRALIGRAAALAAAAAAVLYRDGDRARRRLRKRHQQVGESALLIEGQLGDAPVLPGGRAAPGPGRRAAGPRRDRADGAACRPGGRRLAVAAAGQRRAGPPRRWTSGGGDPAGRRSGRPPARGLEREGPPHRPQARGCDTWLRGKRRPMAGTSGRQRRRWTSRFGGHHPVCHPDDGPTAQLGPRGG